MSKYNSKKVLKDGFWFDSKGEAERYKYLSEAEKEGLITGLMRQVEYVLIPAFTLAGKKYRPTRYIADFVYIVDGVEIVEDFKGMKTPEYRIKKKLMAWLNGVYIHEVTKWNDSIPGRFD
jgi:hypothetical protein